MEKRPYLLEDVHRVISKGSVRMSATYFQMAQPKKLYRSRDKKQEWEKQSLINLNEERMGVSWYSSFSFSGG